MIEKFRLVRKTFPKDLVDSKEVDLFIPPPPLKVSGVYGNHISVCAVVLFTSFVQRNISISNSYKWHIVWGKQGLYNYTKWNQNNYLIHMLYTKNYFLLLNVPRHTKMLFYWSMNLFWKMILQSGPISVSVIWFFDFFYFYFFLGGRGGGMGKNVLTANIVL